MSERMFFDEHQWRTVEAATSRIIPTDHQPGAREAGVVTFIDRYLSGIDYIFANPWGSGFLPLAGRQADAWRQRIETLRARYVDGLAKIDALSDASYGMLFVMLDAELQDDILVRLSGADAKPEPLLISGRASDPAPEEEEKGLEAEPGLANDKEGIAVGPAVWLRDDSGDFFGTLVLHTRQGFYSDPAYGGNQDRIGWQVIGFPGPNSLAETRDGRFSTVAYMDQIDYQVVAPEALQLME